MWAAGLAWSGRIGSGLAIQPGRALAFANDPAWPSALELVGGRDLAVTADVADGLTQVLSRWRAQWIERPTVIVPVPSARHPELVGSLAQAISAVGLVPVVDALQVDGPPGDADASARARAKVQGDRLSLLPGVSLDGETVLLVDDTWRTGWTATIAGALLREAGANHVLPLVIHQRP
jgi:ATP-dependent DNA helicase RecQ